MQTCARVLSCHKISSCTVAKSRVIIVYNRNLRQFKALNFKKLVAPGVYTPHPLETSYYACDCLSLLALTHAEELYIGSVMCAWKCP